MPSVATPIWLIGLAVIPLVWWLHRLGDPDDAFPVSAIFLFYAEAHEAKAGHALPPANPLWILRATLLSLLVLALAGLSLPQEPDRDITVWFDDSLSMRTLEGGLPRSEIAARELGAALAEAGPGKVRIRALSDHRRQFDASELAGERSTAAIVRWADSDEPGVPQIPFSLSRKEENWLVSDGADDRINTWLDQAEFARTIVVGTEIENTAITALMARRALQQDAMHQGSVRVQNPGSAASKRTLSVSAGGRRVLREDLEIAPGGAGYRDFRIPADAALLLAELLPADALPQDDTIEIGLAELQPAVVDFDSRCGSRLRGALNAHPGLELRAAPDRETALTVRCAPSPGPFAIKRDSFIPSINVHSAVEYRALTGPVTWHRPLAGVGGMALDGAWLRINPSSARPPSDLTLLSSAGTGLSLIDARTDAIDVFMDLETAPVVERPEYPLLVNALVELALARPVLDPVVHIARNLDESRIARQPAAGYIASTATAKPASTGITPYLLVLALALLLADVLFSLRAGAHRQWPSRSAS